MECRAAILTVALTLAAASAQASGAESSHWSSWNPITGLLDYASLAQAEVTAQDEPAMVTPIPAATALERQIDGLRDRALANFTKGNRQTAIRLNARALKLARRLPPTSWRTVENYDYAGMYYYDAHRWKKSAQHQAIAVLLACGEQETAHMYAVYVERLGWAFARYRPQQDFAPIAQDPLALLRDLRLNVRADNNLRRRYFKTIRSRDTPAGEPPRYIYQLRADVLPEFCGVAKQI